MVIRLMCDSFSHLIPFICAVSVLVFFARSVFNIAQQFTQITITYALTCGASVTFFSDLYKAKGSMKRLHRTNGHYKIHIILYKLYA